MCCFSGHIDKVSRTRIFARNKGSVQTLVYAMDLATPEDLAMILPIPVKAGTKKIEFIDLSQNNDFFEQIETLFPLVTLSRSSDLCVSASAQLEVEQVGAYDASFVPTVDDMDRLDKRFAIQRSIWNEIPEYANFGFAVFKLSKGNAERHPMAFRFETRNPERIFFPTVHIHDGKLPKEEEFDHTLYAQAEGRIAGGWRKSNPAGREMVLEMKGTIIEGPVYKTTIKGKCPNKDMYVNAGR